MGLDFDLFGQAFVVIAQDGDDFVTTKVIRQVVAFGKHFSQYGSGEKNAVFFAMKETVQPESNIEWIEIGYRSGYGGTSPSGRTSGYRF